MKKGFYLAVPVLFSLLFGGTAFAKFSTTDKSAKTPASRSSLPAISQGTGKIVSQKPSIINKKRLLPIIGEMECVKAQNDCIAERTGNMSVNDLPSSSIDACVAAKGKQCEAICAAGDGEINAQWEFLPGIFGHTVCRNNIVSHAGYSCFPSETVETVQDLSYRDIRVYFCHNGYITTFEFPGLHMAAGSSHACNMGSYTVGRGETRTNNANEDCISEVVNGEERPIICISEVRENNTHCMITLRRPL